MAAPSQGFAEHEVVALAAVMQNLDHEEGHASMWQIHRDMEASGYTRIASTFALKVLVQRDYLTVDGYEDSDGDQYKGYSLTANGWAWVLANQDRFALRKLSRSRPPPPSQRPPRPPQNQRVGLTTWTTTYRSSVLS